MTTARLQQRGSRRARWQGIGCRLHDTNGANGARLEFVARGVARRIAILELQVKV